MSLPILHVVRSLNPAEGGPAELVRQLCAAHAGIGIHSEVAALDAPGAPWLSSGLDGTRTHTFSGRGRYGWTPALAPWIRSHASEFAGVFAHGLWQWQSAGVWRALRGLATPYFLFPHGMLDPWFRAAWPLKHARKALYWRTLEYRVARDAAAVLFTSEEERVLGRETFRPWNPKREVVVPLGTTAPPASAEMLRKLFFERFPALNGKRLLLFLGRLHEKKGLDLLVEAFRRASGPLHLVIAGPCADPGFLQRLRQMAEGLPVTFTGPLYGNEKWSALAAAEVFVLPSHQENFGVAVAEALASGVPVLISNKVNIWREIVAAGAGMAEPDTTEGAVCLLERWLAADHASFRSAAIRCFAARFDIRRTAENLMSLVAART